MKRLVLTLPTAMLALSCTLAIAQVGRYQPSSPPPSQTLQRDQQDAQMRRQADAPTSTFDQLDTEHLGYVTAAGARKDAWLAKHFKKCDTNGDGQVSRTEYDACTTKQTTP